MAKLVSKTYGDALFALAVEEHMVDQLYEEAQAVAQILRENTELTRLMNHPKIEKEEKVRLIEDIFKGRIGDELVGLLRMLVQKGHYKETCAPSWATKSVGRKPTSTKVCAAPTGASGHLQTWESILPFMRPVPLPCSGEGWATYE